MNKFNVYWGEILMSKGKKYIKFRNKYIFFIKEKLESTLEGKGRKRMFQSLPLQSSKYF